MAEELLGCWKLITSEKFDEYMKEVGVSSTTRMAANALKPDVSISKNGDDWCIKTVSTFKTVELCFKLNELFDECTADGRKCKTIIQLVNGKLIQTQKWQDNESIITREVQNGQMITECICRDVKSRRVYQRKS